MNIMAFKTVMVEVEDDEDEDMAAQIATDESFSFEQNKEVNSVNLVKPDAVERYRKHADDSYPCT